MNDPTWMSNDVVIACVELFGRCGAKELELGFAREDVPVEEAGWYAQVSYRGARIMVQDHRSPSGAALALAERLLYKAVCKCGQPVAINDDTPGCRWRLMGKHWESGCDAPPMKVDGERGDMSAMRQAFETAAASRWERRGQRPKRKRRRG